MAIIRPSNLQTVAPQAAPNALLRSDADIASFGGTQARDQVVAGQQLERASDSLANVALAEMRDANETRVQDLNNQFINAQHAALYTSPDAFYRLKGADAINGAEKATDRLIELKKQTVDAAANPYQRQRLSGIIDSHVNGATAGISRHVVSEQATYDKSVAVAAVETATHSAILDPSQLPLAIDRARGAAASLYKGQSAEVIANAQLKAESDVYSGVIRHMINTNDRSALDLYKKVGDRLDVKDRERIEPAIKTMQLGVTAQVQAAEFKQLAGPPPNPKDAVGVVRHFEGLLLKAEKDTDGKYRVGYGSDTVTRADGKPEKVTADTVVTEEDAKRDLARRIPLFQDDLKKKIGISAWDALTPEAQASLSSIVYNYGSLPDSLVKPVQSGDPAQIAQAIRGLSGHNGGINAGRRAREAVSVSDAAPTDPSKPNGQAYVDPHVMLQKANDRFDAATLLNQQRNANDDNQRRATQSQLDVELANSKRQIEAAKNDLIIEVDRVMKTGGPNGGVVTNLNQISPDLWSRLDYNKQRSLEGVIKHNASGTDPAFTPDAKRTFMELSDMATNDPNKFRDTDLNDYVPVLPTAQILTLQALKNQIQKAGQVEYNTTTALTMADKSLALQGVDTRSQGASDKDVALRQEMHAKLLDWLARYQDKNKHAPKDSEVRQKIDYMLIEGRTTPPGFFERNGIWGQPQQGLGAPNATGARGQRGTTPGAVFEFTVPEEKKGSFAPIYSNIPAETRTSIENELKGNGSFGSMTQTEWDRQRLVEDTYSNYMKVPLVERQKIADALRRAGTEPTWSGIINLYNAKMAK